MAGPILESECCSMNSLLCNVFKHWSATLHVFHTGVWWHFSFCSNLWTLIEAHCRVLQCSVASFQTLQSIGQPSRSPSVIFQENLTLYIGGLQNPKITNSHLHSLLPSIFSHVFPLTMFPHVDCFLYQLHKTNQNPGYVLLLTKRLLFVWFWFCVNHPVYSRHTPCNLVWYSEY